MARPRFFLSAPLGTGDHVDAELSAEDLHHLTDVLRIGAGDEIVLVEPAGAAWDVRVVSTAGRLRVSKVAAVVSPWEPHVTLVVGVAKGPKVDDGIEGAVEVGVERVIPVLTSRSVVKLDARKRAERAARWRRVALAAAKQSQRAFVPEVAEPAKLADVAAELAAFDAVFVAWEEADGRTMTEAIAERLSDPSARVAVVVGPEGGLTAKEVEALEAIGAMTVTLGPTILRSETAAVVAPALAIAALRELRANSTRA